MPAKTNFESERSDWFDELSDSSLMRIQQIVASPENPSPLVKVSPSTWWRMVRTGKAPQPVKISNGITAWRVGDIRSWLENPSRYRNVGGSV